MVKSPKKTPQKKTTVKKAAIPVLKPLKKKVDAKKVEMKKDSVKKEGVKKIGADKKADDTMIKQSASKKTTAKKAAPKKTTNAHVIKKKLSHLKDASPQAANANILDDLFDVITSRKSADPAISHSARLLARGRHKIAQKFGEEAVECLIEATAGNSKELIAESADVLYHLIVMWVDAGVTPVAVWEELARRQGISGIAEKAARPKEIYSILLSED